MSENPNIETAKSALASAEKAQYRDAAKGWLDVATAHALVAIAEEQRTANLIAAARLGVEIDTSETLVTVNINEINERMGK